MCWTGGGSTIGVVPFLKALLLELVSTMMSLPVVNLRFSAPGRCEEVGLPREVGATALGRGSATITRDETPFFGVWFFAWEWQTPGTGAWVLGRKSELLYLSWATVTCRGLLLRTRLFWHR